MPVPPDKEGRVGIIEHLLPVLGDVLHQHAGQWHMLAVLILAGELQSDGLLGITDQ